MTLKGEASPRTLWLKLNSATRGYRRKLINHINDIRPINRPKSLEAKTRLIKKLTAKFNWFSKPKMPQSKDEQFKVPLITHKPLNNKRKHHVTCWA